MTVGDAAKYLGVGRKIIYQMIEFDQIRAVRENRAVLVEKRSLDEFRASGELNWNWFYTILIFFRLSLNLPFKLRLTLALKVFDLELITV